MPHPARPTVTLRDVAVAAGVSVSTASRVLNGSARTVAPEYEQRVLVAAAALRYTTDASAQAMRRASGSIALVADDLTTPSIGLVVAAMERQARSVGAFVTVSSTRGTAERQMETVRLLRALRPRALVLTSSRIAAESVHGRLLSELRGYEAEGGRVVIVGDTDMPFDSISFDNEGTARDVGAYVARLGHRRVAILAGDRERTTFSARTAGFLAGLREGGLRTRDVRVLDCEVSRQGGYDAAQRLIARGLERVDAVLAGNDLIAIGAMSAFRSVGVEVPADVSLTGFDDIQLAVDVTPRLTTAALPLANVGVEAIQLAVEPGSEVRRLTVRGHLVVRDSTTTRAHASAPAPALGPRAASVPASG